MIFMRIVFVCHANICRSPMAEVIFKSLVNDVEVISAGLFTSPGEKASTNAVEICKYNNLDLTYHRSKRFHDLDIKEDDLILTLTTDIRDNIKDSFPDLEVYTIKEYAGEKEYLDIKDPVGGNLEVYETCFCEIKYYLEIIAGSLD